MVNEIFSCKRCGFCCHGETTVSLNINDQEIMQEALGISRLEMFEKYLRVTGNVVQMKIIDGHCVFYSEKGCAVHLGRPWRCRQWPLHPALMVSHDNIKIIRESCPGFDKDVSDEKIAQKIKKHLEKIEQH